MCQIDFFPPKYLVHILPTFKYQHLCAHVWFKGLPNSKGSFVLFWYILHIFRKWSPLCFCGNSDNARRCILIISHPLTIKDYVSWHFKAVNIRWIRAFISISSKVLQIIPRSALIKCPLLHENIQKETDTEKEKSVLSNFRGLHDSSKE